MGQHTQTLLNVLLSIDSALDFQPSQYAFPNANLSPMTTITNDTPAERHSRFYQESVVFEVESTLFRVPRYGFDKSSEIFAVMFSLPQSADGGPTEGIDDQHPFKLDGYKKAEFESLLEVMYPFGDAPLRTLTTEEWTNVLKLSTIWEMAKFRNIAISAMSAVGMTPFQKVSLGREYRVPEWLTQGYTSLVQLDTDQLPPEYLGGQIGWEAAARIFWIKFKNPTEFSVASGSSKKKKKSTRQTVQCDNCRYVNEIYSLGEQSCANCRNILRLFPEVTTQEKEQELMKMVTDAFQDEFKSMLMM